MDFSWGELFDFFWIAVGIVVVKTFFERKERERFFSYQMAIDVLILTVLLHASTWLITQF